MITKAEWEAKGKELFGEDRANWAFVCPSCGNAMSIARARAEFPALKGRGWQPESECIGRYLPDVGCDWCSYGLFKGPLIVDTGDPVGEVAVFDFAGKPFTEKQVKP